MWSNVSKPSTLAYTNVNPAGKTQYDQADIEYDDSAIYYDGDINNWSDISKPVSSTWTKVSKPT